MSDQQPAYARAAHVIDRRDAKIVTDALTAQGLQCWSSVDGDAAFTQGSQMGGFTSGFLIIVLQQDLDRAKQIIAEL